MFKYYIHVYNVCQVLHKLTLEWFFIVIMKQTTATPNSQISRAVEYNLYILCFQTGLDQMWCRTGNPNSKLF